MSFFFSTETFPQPEPYRYIWPDIVGHKQSSQCDSANREPAEDSHVARRRTSL